MLRTMCDGIINAHTHKHTRTTECAHIGVGKQEHKPGFSNPSKFLWALKQNG